MIQTSELWQKFVDHENREAYYKLYVHYYSYLSFVGVKRAFDSELVKDAINDIFLLFWEKRKSLKHIQSSHNYIVTCFLRKLLKKNLLISREIEEAELSVEYDFEEYVFKGQESNLFQEIKKQIASLPPKQRQLIYQKYYLGLSYNEISKANNLSINTVYNTIYTAINKLKVTIARTKVLELLALLTVVNFFFN